MTPQQANLMSIASEMSNVLYNLGQHKRREITEQEAELFYALAKKWDEARRAPAPTEPAVDRDAVAEYKVGKWFDARTVDEMQAFYLSRLPAIREAAKEHGYAIGLHGSTRRDFDLLAMQWSADASDKDTLAHAIAVAACGISSSGTYDWEAKPKGRFAVSLPICWTDPANPDFDDMISAGHIDLSIIATPASPAVPEDRSTWKLMPPDATEAMMHAAQDIPEPRPYGAVYRAMFSTAPQVAQASQPTSAEGKDSERLDWLDSQGFSYGFEDMHEGNDWSIKGPFASIRAAIDAGRARTGKDTDKEATK